MAKKTILLLFCLGFMAAFARAATNPWGDLKKIYFYNASGNVNEVRKNLDSLDAQALPPAEKIELMKKLAELGDRFYNKNDFGLAESFYRKTLKISPVDGWPLYNKLEKISRQQGHTLWNLRNVGQQFRLITHDFSSTFLLVDSFFNVLLFSGLFLFFVIASIMFFKYFKLAAYDFIISGSSGFSRRKLLLLLLLLLWPLFFLGGWGFYPFLFCGFLWHYFTKAEQANIKRITVILLILVFIHAFAQYLEKSLESPGLRTIQKIYAGHLFPESTTSRFDNEMKVIQANAYYEQDQADAAMNLLQDTGSQYTSTLKLNLLGNMYYEKGDSSQSIQYFRQSLSLDNQNQMTLKNFTLALLKNNDPELFRFYSKNYPQIEGLKDSVSTLQKSKLPASFLWKRLLNYSWQDFHFWHFLKQITIAFLQFPLLLVLLAMLAYTLLLKRFFPALGQSTFCNKCSKVIKTKAFDQAHALCDECYQLFLIKDPIFLEAKILKEKEISRQSHWKHTLIMLVSLFIPGFILNFKDKGKVFALLFLLFFNIFGFFLFTAWSFKNIFGVIPMFLNIIGLVGIVVFLAINVYALREYQNGF
jgi:tetratricopeptide (TPR) repeat protein